MQISDLKIGMILVNTGTKAIPLYHDQQASGKVALTIKPGEVIGQIVDFGSGVGGATVTFVDHSEVGAIEVTTGPITSSGRAGEKLLSYSLSWLLDPVKVSATARFADIRANVSDDQIIEQGSAIQNAKANGVSLSNEIKKGQRVQLILHPKL